MARNGRRGDLPLGALHLGRGATQESSQTMIYFNGAAVPP